VCYFRGRSIQGTESSLKTIQIDLTNDSCSVYTLEFQLLDIEIADKWSQELEAVLRSGIAIDDPERFYCFPGTKFTKQYVISYINLLVDTINEYSPGLVVFQATDDIDQDTLNYLHSVFEKYHGLYDKQNENEFYSRAPIKVQDALADLNIWVHRYESLNYFPRFVVTWREKPERKKFDDSDYRHFSLYEEWGDLRINYCEIGKSLYDLYRDNDRYISPEAFLPQDYYSCDFTVRFSDRTKEYYDSEEENVWNYYELNQGFFQSRGYKKYDPKLSLGNITVAKIIQQDSRESMIEKIAKHQSILGISFG